ncbi:MAG TPA: hypothetical protein VFW24_12845 [Acidimicrobiales bacterium]|nr:hypothetical protein [Acidimicrobiales bacterium]
MRGRETSLMEIIWVADAMTPVPEALTPEALTPEAPLHPRTGGR